mgnify:CR=1 FL=1
MLIFHKTSSTTLACASLACLLLLAACKTETIVPQPEEPEQPAQPLQSIRWSVCSAETRALVDDNILQTSCIPVESGNYHSIGVWGQYTINENGQQTTNTEFSATPLTFSRKPTDTNPYNDWNYPGDTRYWRMDAKYDFRACYPQKRMTELMTQMDATIIQGAVNTSVLQEDLLVAAAQVSTAITTPRGPVPLLMKHIFAALRFKIMPKEATHRLHRNVLPAAGCRIQETQPTSSHLPVTLYIQEMQTRKSHGMPTSRLHNPCISGNMQDSPLLQKHSCTRQTEQQQDKNTPPTTVGSWWFLNP